ncbi:MAG: hypothetical protein KAR20_18815 [Candidatus Heimdallarchaeota archaeon]|nr:hypothetical protein [Candidatus Heimdallarchaeota archaeon]
MKLSKVAMVMIPILCLLLSSCGQRHYVVHLDLNAYSNRYTTNNIISTKPPPSITFSEGDYIDKRKNKEYFGLSRGGHIISTDNDFKEAFYDGLKIFIQSSNQSWADNGEGDIKIDVELLETNSDIIKGFWAGRHTSSVSIKTKFIDLKNNTTIYQKIYEGSSFLMVAPAKKGSLVSVVNMSIINCINKIGMDQKLNEALTKMTIEK